MFSFVGARSMWAFPMSMVVFAAGLGLSFLSGSLCAQNTLKTVVEGHVLHSSTSSKIPGVLVMAWPCGLAVASDAAGAFRVSCPHGVDSLTLSCLGFQTEVVHRPDVHVDIHLNPLSVHLGQAIVEVVGQPETEMTILNEGALMETLDRTPGLQSLDLGGGVVQPVIRGLFGSRVAVLEDGVPQRGSRWGSDHGILVAPELNVVSGWVPGGGHVWMGPDAVAGGLRFESPSRTNAPGSGTRLGTSLRLGNLRASTHALHWETTPEGHWHAGISASKFGSTQVPQRMFSYLGRTYELSEGELPNTAGQSAHLVIGLEQLTQSGHEWRVGGKVSDMRQGLFPGIVGVPRQQDLAPNEGRFERRLPQQRASRCLATWGWNHTAGNANRWKAMGSVGWIRRIERAPPHAHGWGPLPDSDVSLLLEEWTGFVELKHLGPHGSMGLQGESQSTTASGWEFLVPNHRRLRGSLVGEWQGGLSSWAARVDVVAARQSGHDEPMYNTWGDVVGVDVRAMAFRTILPGGMLSWQLPLRWRKQPLGGTLTVAAFGRVPSNYEWGANGIHHGTFRYEQGNPELNTEWTFEGRLQLQERNEDLGWSHLFQGFVALHRGFISLTPSATFAPIAHAGQILRFQANNAFRTGAEGTISWKNNGQMWTLMASVLGQWDLGTGLGLPFTTPAQLRLSWQHNLWRGCTVELSTRGVAPAQLTARNEAATPGAVLVDFNFGQTTRRGFWSLDVQNVFNAAWLDHISAYRALGIAAQGRWVQVQFSTTLKHNSKK
ncbi:MAG: hypothetical protein ACPGYK_05395 [Flavobacteriales bacterium]